MLTKQHRGIQPETQVGVPVNRVLTGPERFRKVRIIPGKRCVFSVNVENQPGAKPRRVRLDVALAGSHGGGPDLQSGGEIVRAIGFARQSGLK